MNLLEKDIFKFNQQVMVYPCQKKKKNKSWFRGWDICECMIDVSIYIDALSLIGTLYNKKILLYDGCCQKGYLL